MTMRGFTLLETLIAVALLALAVAGPLYTAEQSYIAVSNTQSAFTASYLAQEGIEFVRALRDDTYLTDVSTGDPENAFSDFLTSNTATSIATCRGSGDGSTVCALDPSVGLTNAALSVCAGGVCPVLKLSGNAYVLSGGTATPFTRSIRFYDEGSTEEVAVTVTWTIRGVSHTTTLREYLTPWQ